MKTRYELGLGGSPAADLLRQSIELLEVEENADRPDALRLRVPVNRTSSGDLAYVGDQTFEPYTNITVTVTPPNQRAQCIFDGYALAWKLHFDRTSGCSTLEVWAQDASWLMNISDSVKEWSGMTDSQVANQIFGDYHFTPPAANDDGSLPSHDPIAHTLFQRATDLQFLRGLARRNGKLCRVACTDSPGVRTGYFITPDVTGTPVTKLSLGDRDAWVADCLEFDWDVMRPTEVDASQLPLDSSAANGVSGNATATGLPALAARDLPTYANAPIPPDATVGTLVLTPTADVAEVPQRATAALRDASWFVRCTGETDVDRLGQTLRVGTVVQLDGAGSLQSGKWFVWSVRHTISIDAIKLRFTLVRNAMGAAASSPGLASALGGL